MKEKIGRLMVSDEFIFCLSVISISTFLKLIYTKGRLDEYKSICDENNC